MVSVLELAWRIQCPVSHFETGWRMFIWHQQVYLSYWDVEAMPLLKWKPSRRVLDTNTEFIFHLCWHVNQKNCLNYKKKNQVLEGNGNHVRQFKPCITNTVSNNYKEITNSSEINSCHRKLIIFYLSSNATRITWQQHNSVETMSVFDEERMLAAGVMYCD